MYHVGALQIEAFVPEYWGGDIYHDVDKAFYKVCGNAAKMLVPGTLIGQWRPLAGNHSLVGCDA
jgi:hypothetical protein